MSKYFQTSEKLEFLLERIRATASAHRDPKVRTELTVLLAIIRFMDLDAPEWRTVLIDRLAQSDLDPSKAPLSFDIIQLKLRLGEISLSLKEFIEE